MQSFRFSMKTLLALMAVCAVLSCCCSTVYQQLTRLTNYRTQSRYLFGAKSGNDEYDVKTTLYEGTHDCWLEMRIEKQTGQTVWYERRNIKHNQVRPGYDVIDKNGRPLQVVRVDGDRVVFQIESDMAAANGGSTRGLEANLSKRPITTRIVPWDDKTTAD